MTVSLAPAFAASHTAGEVRERIERARERRAPVRIVGACTWLDAGRPVRAQTRLDVGMHAGIVEYVPGDLTLTALAGTPLAELERVTAAERQWLPLDPFGPDGGTLGATVATASAGPLAHGVGSVRDNVLGVEIVTGRGEIVRAGGRVVKNVAGFDLTRLMTGAWGTLGIITEVSVRLRARPEVDRTIAIPLPEAASDIQRVLGAVRQAPVAPLALQLVNAAMARRIGLDPRAALVARLGGNEEAVQAQMLALASVGETLEVPATLWRAFRECEPAGGLAMRIAGRPSDIAERWFVMRREIDAACARATGNGAKTDGEASLASRVLVHAWVGSGSVRVITPADGEPLLDDLLFAVKRSALEGRAIGERLTPALWSRLGSPADEPLARRVRAAFDPDLLLNPGILGETLP